MDQGYLQKMEVGERPVKIEWLRQIAVGLNVSVGDLLNPDDNPEQLNEIEKSVIDAMRNSRYIAHMVMCLVEGSAKFQSE